MQTPPRASRTLAAVAAVLTTGLLAGCGKDQGPRGQAVTQPGPPAMRGGPARRAPDEQTGVKVGERAPKFRLKDQKGEERSLDDLLKGGTVALVFFRSASW